VKKVNKPFVYVDITLAPVISDHSTRKYVK
jgi:hypothetical protein